MTRIRATLGVFAVVFALMFGANQAAVANHNANGPQTTGGVVINSAQSEGSIYVSRDKPADYYSVVPTGKRSDQPAARPIMKNVQGFKVAQGYRLINVKTGYVYVGGEWHYMCCNNTVLTLRVDWLGNNKTAAINAAPIALVRPAVVSCSNVTRIYVSGNSNGKVIAKDGSAAVDVWAYQDTCLYYGWSDVDYFWVPGGCDAYNNDTGWRYAGATQYGPLAASVRRLSLHVVC